MRKGWEIKKLSEVCQFINGRAYNKQELLDEGKYTVLRVGNFFTSDLWYYSDLELEEDKYCDTGDLLYAWSASFGPKIWDGGKVIYHYHIWKVIPNENLVTKEFLYHFLDWDKDQIKIDQGTGTTMTHVSKGSMDDRLINIPLLPEQQRIVSLLEEAFASIAQAKSNAEQNLANARELFGSYMESLFADSRAGWEEKKLGEVCERITDGTHVTPKYVPEGVPFLSVKNLTKGFIDFSDTRFISPEEHKFLTKNVRPERDDLLYTKVGTTGVAQVVDVDVKFSIFVSIALLKLKHGMIFSKYLEFFLNSPFARKQAQARTRGMANKNLVITDIKEIEIHFPKSIAEQRVIVGRLEVLSVETKRLEDIYKAKLRSLEELKKSILAKAFAGEL